MTQQVPAPHTKAEIFIIESVEFADEESGKFEGRILADILRLCEMQPRYFYCRTKKELEKISDIFSVSKFRYLHLSCHGTADAIELGLDSVPFADFAEIFRDKLKNRRLFVSACDVGNANLIDAVSATNRGMYSIIAPTDAIAFSHAMAFWSSFYTRIFDLKPGGVKNTTITETIKMLNPLFKTRFRWAYHDTVNNQWKTEELGV